MISLRKCLYGGLDQLKQIAGEDAACDDNDNHHRNEEGLPGHVAGVIWSIFGWMCLASGLLWGFLSDRFSPVQSPHLLQ